MRILRKMSVLRTMECYHTLVRMGRALTALNSSEDIENLTHYWWDCKMVLPIR
jgi:hypothetical protein